MISTCPKCGDYYADASLAFCLADGTPLNRVDPAGENWREGSRVIEVKQNALKKQTRKLKWRRVLLRAMTAVVVTMVVCVVAINSLIYLRPRPEKDTEPGAPLPPVITTQTLVPTSSPTPVKTSTPKCEVADKSLERKSILKKYGGTWERNIKGEYDRILLANMPAGAANANGLLGIQRPEVSLISIEFGTKFPKDCAASVTARYVWRVTKNINGTIENVDIKREKRFGCAKSVEAWRCS